MSNSESARKAYQRISPSVTPRRKKRGVEGYPTNGWVFDETQEPEETQDPSQRCSWCDSKMCKYTYTILHPETGLRLDKIGGVCACKLVSSDEQLKYFDFYHSLTRSLSKRNETHRTLYDNRSAKLTVTTIPEGYLALITNSTKRKVLATIRAATTQELIAALKETISQLPITTYRPRKTVKTDSSNDAAF